MVELTKKKKKNPVSGLFEVVFLLSNTHATIAVSLIPLIFTYKLVELPFLKDPPPFLERLLNMSNYQRLIKFRIGIRIYNSLHFHFLEGTIDRSMNNGTASYVFRLSSQNHHRIGSLIPIHGAENKLANRISAVIRDDRT